jgi:hypothetical protein
MHKANPAVGPAETWKEYRWVYVRDVDTFWDHLNGGMKLNCHSYRLQSNRKPPNRHTDMEMSVGDVTSPTLIRFSRRQGSLDDRLPFKVIFKNFGFRRCVLCGEDCLPKTASSTPVNARDFISRCHVPGTSRLWTPLRGFPRRRRKRYRADVVARS